MSVIACLARPPGLVPRLSRRREWPLHDWWIVRAEIAHGVSRVGELATRVRRCWPPKA